MSHASGQPQHRRIASWAWRVVLLGWCVVACACGAKKAAEAGGVGADADSDVWLDVAGDAEDAADVDVADGGTDAVTDAVGDGEDAVDVDMVDGVTDAVTDAVGDGQDAVDVDVADGVTDAVQVDDGPDADVVEVDIPIVDATPAVDTAVPCSASEIPAALTGTVEFEAAAYISNPVVMGCAKGPPKSVKVGTPCCDCQPPYSCYCNGECGWLRAPDLVKPQHDGQAVWTGKWVVSLGEPYNPSYFDSGNCLAVQPDGFNLQRWQPGSGKGFEVVTMPFGNLAPGQAVAFNWGSKVVIGTERRACQFFTKNDKAPGFGPDAPIYLYDPETNVFSKITMPICEKLLRVGDTLACVVKWESALPGQQGGVQVYDSWEKWTLVQPPVTIAGKNWASSYPADSVADDQAVYLVGAITTAGPWPDGSPGWPGPGHILKYEVKNQKWSDIGVVPVEWQAGPLMMDHIGIVRVKGAIQAARFRLDTFKWEVGPKTTYGMYGHQDPTLTPCGLLFGSGDLGDALGGGMAYRPVLLGPDLSWTVLPPWGYPNDAKTSRHSANFVLTDKELFALGGMNGPPDGNFVYHKDSYRYPLAALCPGGKP